MAAVHEAVFCSLGCKNVTAMSPTGSETTTNTTGIVVVASWAVATKLIKGATVPGTTQTSRSRPDMSVHWGEAVKVTPHSK